MLRSLAGAGLAVLLGVSALDADEVKGTVKTTDTTKNKITLSVDGKNTQYDVGKDASFVTVSQVAGKKGKVTEKVTPIENGLGGVKVGANVTVLTEKVDDVDTVTSIKVSDAAAAKNPAPGGKNKKKKKKKT